MSDFIKEVNFCITNNKLEKLKTLINNGDDLDINGFNFTKYAVHTGNEEAFDFLFENKLLRHSETEVLEMAIKKENISILKKILNNKDFIRYQSRNHYNIFSSIKKENNKELIEAILDSFVVIRKEDLIKLYDIILGNELFEVFKYILKREEFEFLFLERDYIPQLGVKPIEYIKEYSKNEKFFPKDTQITERAFSFGKKEVFQYILQLGIVDKEFLKKMLNKAKRRGSNRTLQMIYLALKEENVIKLIDEDLINSIDDKNLKQKIKLAKKAFNIASF